MSNSSSCAEEEAAEVIETLFLGDIDSSSEEPPMEEWSSLLVATPPDSPKKALEKQGLYDPGSGEICTKYIAMSDSEVLRHVYYKYPAVVDPGIMDALLNPEPKITLDYDGRELYMKLCSEMNIIPIRGFHRALLNDAIDLKYYGVNPVGIRAMCLALTNNKYVSRLDLTSNYLTEDACYHLGQLLGESFALKELVLTSCRIKAEGMKRLMLMMAGRTLKLFDLSKNDFGDEGFQYLANQMIKGAVIKQLNLSYNNLTHVSALAFAEALEGNNSITHLDLSWNKLFSLKDSQKDELGGITDLIIFFTIWMDCVKSDMCERDSNQLLKQLGDSKVLVELNISWNNLTTGIMLRRILNIPTLCILNLSNNRLSNFAAKALNLRLHIAKQLKTLDLSYNPFTPAQAFLILTKLREEEVVLENLLMDDVGVTKEFIEEMDEILSLEYRANTKITYGWVIHDYTLSRPDLRRIVMRRLDYIARSGKNNTIDIMLYFLEQYKVRERPKLMQPREIAKKLRSLVIIYDDDLLEELANVFPGPKLEKGGKTINLAGVVEYIQRLWPEKKLPPTPPPAPVLKRAKSKKKKKARGKK